MDKILAINIPIFTDQKMICSVCKEDGVEIRVDPEDSTMTALMELIRMDLNERGFEFEIIQAVCKNTVSALFVITVGSCTARIITLKLKL